MAKFEYRPRTHADWEVNFMWTNLYVRDGRVETDDTETFDTLILMGFEEVEAFDHEQIQKVVPSPQDLADAEHFEAIVADVLGDNAIQKDEDAASEDAPAEEEVDASEEVPADETQTVDRSDEANQPATKRPRVRK